MSSKAKKNQVQATEPAQDVSSASENISLDNSEVDVDAHLTRIDQEVRLAEAQPGDIEALEAALDEAHEDIAELEEALCHIEPVLSLVITQRNMISELITRLQAQSTPASFTPTGQMPDRKAQALMLLNPNNQSTWPGPPVTIKDLAQAMQITSKNVSSVLSGLRDQGYHIATDNLGRKFISNFTPGQSAKTSRYTSYEAQANTSTITSDELTNLISKANQTIVKRTVSTDGTTTIKPVVTQ